MLYPAAYDLERQPKEKTMGRPLNKRFFGNNNTPPIGGEGVASVTLVDLGAYTTRPTVTFSAPDLGGLGGVTATGTVTSEVESVTAVGGTQTGYTVGQLVTVNGTDAVLRVATIGGDGGDDALTFDFTGGSRGTFTTLPSGAQTTTSNGAGAGLTVTLRFRAKAVVITNAGSGYTDATDAAATFTESVTGTSVLTTTRDNAITMTGRVVAGSTVTLDIVKQTGSRRYRATDGTNTGLVSLVSAAPNAAGEAAIVATDSAGGTYYVTKLTAHRAVVVPGTGTQFVLDSSVPWTLGDAVANVSVKISNS
jgi:hypothetical protein